VHVSKITVDCQLYKFTNIYTTSLLIKYLKNSTLWWGGGVEREGIGLSMHFKLLYRGNLIPPKYLRVLK